MIGQWIRFGLCALFVVCGLFVEVVGIFGLYRFNLPLSRIHSSALGDTLGLSLVVIGLIFAAGFSAVSLKLLLVVAFLWIAGPISSHLIARLEYITDEKLRDGCTVIREPSAAAGREEERPNGSL